MRYILKTAEDDRLLDQLIERGLPKATDQPEDYSGFIVIKPWGYEFQVYDDKNNCSVWLACIKPGQAVSMHCHQHKQVVFIPLSRGLTFRTLRQSETFSEYIAIEKGVFHSQENNTDHDAFFMECEWPSEKTDLVRYKDRYGRSMKGYEGRSKMVPFPEAGSLNMPAMMQMFMQQVA